MNYDFGGWATKHNIKCEDGLTISPEAFTAEDGKKVPLVWNHKHDSVDNVLGHAILEYRPEGLYSYCVFNETPNGQKAKSLVQSNDISALSIWANELTKKGKILTHGVIREVSLVLAGCNPGAGIDPDSIKHSLDDDYEDEDGVIYGEEGSITLDTELSHSVKKKKCGEKTEPDDKTVKHNDDKEESKLKETPNEDPKDTSKEEPEEEATVKKVLETLNEDQKKAVEILLAAAIEEAANQNDETEEGENDMKHNVFDKETEDTTLKHSATDISAAIGDATNKGTMKNSFIQHGITDIDYLFPDAKTMTNTPAFISRKMDWVTNFMNKAHHTPFARVKSVFANLNGDDARARGYIKTKQKAEEVFALLKRTTTPTTIYKKQKFDRDDIIDITDLDVIAWVKTEMRMMLDEEIARAALVGDGRSSSSDDKVNEQNIRPIWTDDDLYTIKGKYTVSATATDDQIAKAFIKTCILTRTDYKGTGSPTLYAAMDIINKCLLLEDTTGRRIYNSMTDLTTALNVSEIVDVSLMAGLTRTVSSETRKLRCIIVNPVDYNFGADKGGAVTMFDDFDIDYNAQKYLIETRCSGAMVTPYAAIAIEEVVGE